MNFITIKRYLFMNRSESALPPDDLFLEQYRYNARNALIIHAEEKAR